MPLVEALCVAIVVLYVAMRGRRDPHPSRFIFRLALIGVAGGVAEDIAIHAYGFYAYNPRWFPFVDQMPLLVCVIWPCVIQSAYDLGQRLLGARHRLLPVAVAAMVLADASLIEPIAVEAGLWNWSEPGLFGVPPIGVLGWAYFALTCAALMQGVENRGAAGAWLLAIIPLGTIIPHALLVGTWWGALRWVNTEIPAWPAVAVAWLSSIPLAILALRRRAWQRVPLADMLGRVPAALFFFVLLAIDGRDVPALVAWAFAFAPPYLALTRGGART